MANVYYACQTTGCPRNQPRRYVTAATAESSGYLCQECGQRLTRRTRPLKGTNTKTAIRFRTGSTSRVRTGPKPNVKKGNRKKISYKR
jgi:hypothetical protein